MAAEHHHEESILEKLKEKIHGHDSSSDSDDDHSSSVKNKVYRLFGRETPLHKVLGSGKVADILLWKNKKTSGAVLGGATAVYAVFELLDYHLLTLVSHILILALTVSFLWANGSHFINKSSPHIPEVHIPEDEFLKVASELRAKVNCGLGVLRNIALGKDLKKFLSVVAGLWVLSIVGSCFSFVTLFYLAFVLLLTVPVVYEKYEDKVDAFAEKAKHKIKLQYAELDAKVLVKLPKGLQKFRKFA